MRPYIQGEPVEAYLVEMTQELVAARPTTVTFVAPVLTAAEMAAIVGPAKGMVVYNTGDNVLHFYNGTAWGAV